MISTTDESTAIASAPANWEHEFAELLALLSTSQGELLQLLAEKRELLVKADLAGLAEIQPREEALIARLQICQIRRGELLERAAAEGLPADSLTSLAAALPGETRGQRKEMEEANARCRLLRHDSLTNWVLVQRTLLHLSQMLEIIATGGKPNTTYGKQASTGNASGGLVDQAA